MGAPLPAGAVHLAVAGAPQTDEAANAAWVRPLVRLEEGGSSLSLTWVSLRGRHERLVSWRTPRLYFVLSGELSFTLADADPVTLTAEELLVVPRGCPYHLEGHGTYLVANTPAFETGDDRYLTGGEPGGDEPQPVRR